MRQQGTHNKNQEDSDDYGRVCIQRYYRPDSCSLSGFIFRKNNPSTSIDSPLSVRVLVLDDSERIFLLVSYELLGLSLDADAALREAVNASLPSECCMLMTTHTHRAPVVCPLQGEPETDPKYLELLCRQTADTATLAVRTVNKSITSPTGSMKNITKDQYLQLF